MARIAAIALLLSTLPGCALASLPIWPAAALQAQPAHQAPRLP